MRGRFGLQIVLGFACAASLVLAQQGPPQPQADNLPPPGFPTNNFSQMIPRGTNELKVPMGFTVSLYAEDLPGVRWMQWSPNGDLFVSQTNRHMITVLRDTNGDGKPDLRRMFAENAAAPRRGPANGPRRGPMGPPANFGPPPTPAIGPGARGDTAAAAVPCTVPTVPARLSPAQRREARILNPMGIAFRPGYIYIANEDSVIRWGYTPGDLEAQGEPRKIAELPGAAGGPHVWRNIIFNNTITKMYVTVGSATGAGDDCRRAAILEFNADGSGYRIFASGLRNPEGLAWQPGTNKLWTAVNERDLLGDDLVPDFITSVKEGGFYGWPYSYIGQHYDPRYSGGQPELVKRAIVPDVLIQAHSAPLGLVFYTGNQFPQRYRNGAFVALHGSWNRSKAAGYKVVFVRFNRDGTPGRVEDFLTGFVVSEGGRNADGSLAPITQWGRPVALTIAGDGSLLVSDDQGGRIWQVRYRGPQGR